MVTGTEVCHTLIFGQQEDVRRDACSVGDKEGFAPRVQNNQALDYVLGVFGLDQGVLPRCECRVVSCLVFVKIPKDAQTIYVPELLVTANLQHHGSAKCAFWFPAERQDDAFEYA